MKALPTTVQQAVVFTHGDPSSGIQGENATIACDGEWLTRLDGMEPDEANATLEQFRTGLAATFTELWGEQAKVTFDFEMEAS